MFFERDTNPTFLLIFQSVDSPDNPLSHRNTPAAAYTCRWSGEVCSKTFTHLSSLKRHMKMHEIEKPYVCNKCGARFAWQRNLEEHQGFHLEEHRLPIHCEHCNKIFVLSREYRMHLTTCGELGMSEELPEITSSSQKEPLCLRVCEEDSTHFENQFYDNASVPVKLQKPCVDTMTTEKQMLKCEYCSESFSGFDNYITHLIREHQRKRPMKHWLQDDKVITKITRLTRFQCGECGKAFKAIASIQAHRLIRSYGHMLSFECHSCKNYFGTEQQLRRHCRRVHLTKKSLVRSCGQCGENFVTRIAFTIHSQKHEKE